MSYDLMVFAPASAPKGRAEFLSWYDEKTEWTEDHSYDDPAVSDPALRAWFMDMIQSFPAMNGPFAITDWPEEDAVVTDYSVGVDLIYAAFAWSLAESAYNRVFELAAKHQLGFYNASSDNGEVWLPDGSGGIAIAHAERADA